MSIDSVRTGCRRGADGGWGRVGKIRHSWTPLVSGCYIEATYHPE
jgi:hypothetical protein